MADLKKLLFTEEHEWIDVKGDVAYIGITEFASKALGDIVFVELPEVDDEIEKGEDFGVVESVKAASEVYSPVTGTVVEINEELEDSPELLNEAPFDNYIVGIQLSNVSQLDGLMDEEAYEKFCDEQ